MDVETVRLVPCLRCGGSGAFPRPLAGWDLGTAWQLCDVCRVPGTVSEVVRDPELRRAAMEVVCRMERWHAGGTDDDFEQLAKAVDALKEALAK